MGIFRFRHFSVENVESAMKVNTDGVLLGALMTVRPLDRTSLDIGTGTGTIALMAAQRLSGLNGRIQDVPDMSPDSDAGTARIVAIDIDEASALEAGRNFAASPWPGMLEAVHSSLADFRTSGAYTCFDHIFSNPPYYDLSLGAPDLRRNAARHTESLSYRDLIACAADIMADDGILSVILPADSELWLMRHARMSGLYPFRIVRIRTTERKKPSRIVVEFYRKRQDTPADSLLTIHDGPSYTHEYMDLTRDFYEKF